MKKQSIFIEEESNNKIEVLNDQHLIQIKGGDLYLQNPPGSNNRPG